jgi:phage host-nuclease inhibitor protein Gam
MAKLKPIKTLQDLESAIAELGSKSAERKALTAATEKKVLAVKADAAEKFQALDEFLNNTLAAVKEYCTLNRAALLKEGMKTAKLSTGEIGWRSNPQTLVIENETELLSALVILELDRFVLNTKTIDKRTLLACPDIVGQLDGVKIVQSESFSVKPYDGSRS